MRTYTNKQLKIALSKSKSYFDILPKLELSKSCGNFNSIKLHIRKLKLDTSHLRGRQSIKNIFRPKIPLYKILVKNSTYTSMSSLKRRLLKKKLLKNKCSICGSPPIWNGKPLVFILDHINGDRYDHRIKNLRLVCHNCNSQLPTFAGRNSSNKWSIDENCFLQYMKKHGLSNALIKYRVNRKYAILILKKNSFRVVRNSDKIIPKNQKIHNKKSCIICGVPTGRKLCVKCAHNKRRKVIWPTKNKLAKEIKINSFLSLSRKYRVSDNAIRKWCRSYNLKF